MDAQEEMIIKKKRTKRPRPASPLSLTMATTSSSCSSGELLGDHHNMNRASPPSSNSGAGLARSVQEEEQEEEEDMANCLMLLAQGSCHKQKPSSEKASAIDVYQCKTCNRCFPSFQALGGHRASHKKPKQPPPPLPPLPPPPTQEDHHQRKHNIPSMEQFKPVELNEESTKLSLQVSSRPLCNPSNNNKIIRVHECSICGAEFNSGQALGGHMRRHRPIPTVTSKVQEEHSQEAAKKPKALLSLDLNLPAPEDDHHLDSKFPFAANEQVVVFSASPLVDCHY